MGVARAIVERGWIAFACGGDGAAHGLLPEARGYCTRWVDPNHFLGRDIDRLLIEAEMLSF